MEKLPLQRTGKISKVFRLIPRRLSLPAVYPAELNSSGYQTLWNKISCGSGPHTSKFFGVSDPAGQNSSGYQTLRNRSKRDLSMCRRPCYHVQGPVYPCAGDFGSTCRGLCIHVQGTVYPSAGDHVSMCRGLSPHAGDGVSTCRGPCIHVHVNI
jgi:hypothetical protein